MSVSLVWFWISWPRNYSPLIYMNSGRWGGWGGECGTNLDIDPFLLGKGAKLVHEDAFSHDEL
jgi:hypothetical protein